MLVQQVGRSDVDNTGKDLAEAGTGPKCANQNDQRHEVRRVRGQEYERKTNELCAAGRSRGFKLEVQL